MFQKALRALWKPQLGGASARPQAAKRPSVGVIDPRRLRDPKTVEKNNRELEFEGQELAAYPSPEEEAGDIAEAIRTNSLGFGFSAAGVPQL
jgi:hypothetical protein